MTDARTEDSSGDDTEIRFRLPRVVAPLPAGASAAHVAIPWRAISVSALVAWGVSRFVYIILTFVAHALPQIRQAPVGGWLGVWQRFDTNWYLSIAGHGYALPQDVAFFPLYPALIRLVSLPLGGNLLVSGMLVAQLSALSALISLGGLAAWETRDQRAATQAMVTLLLYPFGFFLTAAYTEGLFVTFTALSLLYARQGRWWLAAGCALLAGATRPTGVALILPLAWEWLRQQGLLQPDQWRAMLRSPRVRAVRAWLLDLERAIHRQLAGPLAVLAVPGFIVALAIYAGLRFGHPMLIVNVRRDYWGLVSAPVWQTIYREVRATILSPLGSSPQIIMALDTLCLAAAAGLTLALWRRQPFAYTLYMLSLLYLCMAQPAAVGAQILQGPGRYLLGALPAFIGVGALLERRPRLAVALGVLCVLIQLYVALRFLTGVLVE